MRYPASLHMVLTHEMERFEKISFCYTVQKSLSSQI